MIPKVKVIEDFEVPLWTSAVRSLIETSTAKT